MRALQKLIAPLIGLLTTLLFILLHSDSTLKFVFLALYITALWLAVTWIPRSHGAPFLHSLRRLSLINLVVMVFITLLFTFSATIFAYYRWGWLFYAAITLAYTVAIRIFTERVDPAAFPARRWQTAYWGLISFSLVGLTLALFLLPAHYSIVDLLLVFWSIGVLPLATAATIGSLKELPIEFPNSVVVAACVVIIVAGSVLNLLTIRNFPNFSTTDEPWLINYVDTYQRTGILDATMVPSSPPVIMGRVWHYATVAWMKFVNGDTFGLRVFSTIGGFALLGIVFALTRAVHKTRTAWMAAALLSVNLAWLAISHVGRQEMWFTAAVWFAFWLSLLARRSTWLGLAAGLTCALSAEIHPLGAVVCLALGIWWVLQWQTRMLSSTALVLFIAGGLLGAAIYLMIHVIPDPEIFLTSINEQMVGKGASGFTPLASVIRRHANYFESNPVELILLIVGCAWAMRHGGKARMVGSFTLLLFIAYALLVSDVNLYYMMTWIPGLVVVYAMMLDHLVGRQRIPLIAFTLAAALLNVVLIRNQENDRWNERVLQALDDVTAQIPEGETTLGDSLFYMGLRNPGFVSSTYVFDQWLSAGEAPWTVVQELAPDWIFDGESSTRFTPNFSVFSIAITDANLIKTAEIDEADLSSQYRLTQVVDTELGRFSIWRRLES